MWIAIGLLAGIGVAIVRWLLTRDRRGLRIGDIGPYGQIKRLFIGHAAELTSRQGPPPPRPKGLDKRLPYTKVVELRRLFPYTDETWSAFHTCYCEVVDSIYEELQAIDPESAWYELLTPARRAIILASELEMEVGNGGFDQYFLNSSGDGATFAPAGLRLLGQEVVAQMVERANAQFPNGPPLDRGLRLQLMDRLGPDASKVWSDLDGEYFAHEIKVGGLVAGCGVPFILAHESEFYLSE